MTQPTARQTFRLAFAIWSAGMVGALSLVIIVLPELLPAMLKGRQLPMPMWALYASNIVQMGFLLAVAAWLGAYLGPVVGLRAPAFEAAVSKQRVLPKINAQVVPALIVGLLVGLGLKFANSFGPEAWVSVQAQYYPSLLVRLLSGGVLEEVLLRWGMMTTLAWLFWRLLQRDGGVPRARVVWSAVIVSALLFGAGHLPAVALMVGELTTGLVAFILGANMVGGIAFGWLYWRYGLECAMIAHAMAHLVNYLIGLA